MVSLTYRKIVPFACVWLALPLAIFVLFWTRLVIGIAMMAVLAVCCFFWIRYGSALPYGRTDYSKPLLLDPLGRKDLQHSKKHPDGCPVQVSKRLLIVLILLALALCAFGGIGGFWFQNNDFDARNAVFRDLVTHSWPVLYDGGTNFLDYYFGFWLPAAVPGKLVLALSGSLDAAWFVANVCLLLWSATGVFMLELLLITFFHTEKPKAIVLILVVFFLFSGWDIVGTIMNGLQHGDVFNQIRNGNSSNVPIHLEWWTFWQYSDTVGMLCWVFNQVIPIWVGMLCILQENRPTSIGFIGVLCLFLTPFCAVGIALIVVLWMLVSAVLSHEGKGWFICLFTPQNILSIVVFVPMFALFFFANTAVGASSSGTSVSSFDLIMQNKRIFLAFLLLEVGVYIIPLLFTRQRKNPLLWIMVLILALIPFGKIGTGGDFCMRASIPSLIFISLMVAHTLLSAFGLHGNAVTSGVHHAQTASTGSKIVAVVLCLVLAVGAVTPLCEYTRGFAKVAKYGWSERLVDQVYSYDGAPSEISINVKGNVEASAFMKIFN